jgi:hypothetical protein
MRSSNARIYSAVLRKFFHGGESQNVALVGTWSAKTIEVKASHASLMSHSEIIASSFWKRRVGAGRAVTWCI